MAENKQYITQEQENGSVMISEDVIASIVSNAIADIDGIAGMSTRPGADVLEVAGKKGWAKGIRITIDKGNELYIDCNVNICYGQNVVDVSNAAQEAVAAAVESIAGVKVARVNVNVCGIIRP